MTPALVITLDYEGSPTLEIRALSYEDEQALWSWLGDTPVLVALAHALVELHRELHTDDRRAA